MSSLTSVYQSFLSNPTVAALNDEASFNYITTLTTINSSAAIGKHFAALQKVLRKKEEKVLNAIENTDSLCLEVETTLEFLTGGGAYLPGLEENFLADHIVTFPIVHIVHFDASQKIRIVRLHWDQGSLLKQVDVIGARARAWPIRDGKDQARLIVSSAASGSKSNGSAKPTSTHAQARETSPSKGARSRNNTNVTRDPHASLTLFAPRDDADDEASPRHSGQAAVAPRASARPPPRDYGDLFAGEEAEAPKSASPQKENRAGKAQSAKPQPRDYHDLFVGHESDASPASKDKINSPLKNITSPIPMAPKGGSNQKFQPIRLFENVGTDATGTSGGHKDSTRQPHPKKYGHFEFGDGDEAEAKQQQPQLARPKTSKHQSQWDFDDFMTPQKAPAKNRPHETRHFGLGEDDSNTESPGKNTHKAQPRPDARPHFEFQDDGSGAGDRRPAGQPRGNVQTHGMGLYQDNVFDEETEGKSTEMRKKDHPLAAVTNLQQRGKTFGDHFSIQDQPSSPPAEGNNDKPLPENRAKATKMMEAQWEASDMSPAPGESKGKENFPTAAGAKNIGIKSGGDGMGGKKGGGRRWGIGDESGGEEAEGMKPKQQTAGRKQQMGRNRTWGFGDESDGEEAGGINAKKFQPQRKQQGHGKYEEWDF